MNREAIDRSRSLLVFKGAGNTESVLLPLNEIPVPIKVATAKRYDSSFFCDKDSIDWFDDWYLNSRDKDIDFYIIESMKKAKDPFQFMRKALLTLKGGCFKIEPVFMDASSSAYQIMAYILQDIGIASSTNLIKSERRHDLYTTLKDEFVDYLRKGNHVTPLVEGLFGRKLIKKIFMPIIYGKTVKAIGDDIYSEMNKYISYKKCLGLASESYKFWRDRYSGVDNLLKLFGCTGGLCSLLGRGVTLPTPLFYSYQDYHKFEKQHVWVYSRRKPKLSRHKISFNVLTTERNVLKSRSATFANFIHQKDAYVAINTVKKFFSFFGDEPIYTVHDCFVSNYMMSEQLPDLYKETLFESLSNPIGLINGFINKNLIEPNYPYYITLKNDSSFDTYVNFNKIEAFISVNPKEVCLSGYHHEHDPIPTDHLNFFLNSWFKATVECLGAKKGKIFEARANDLIMFYKKYVASLCDGIVVESSYGNPNFISEMEAQRTALKRRMVSFANECFDSSRKNERNYSLT